MAERTFIEKEALISDLVHNRSFYPAIVKAAIENAPAADVVEVVRCKVCVHYQPMDSSHNYKGKPAMICAWHNRLSPENGYCNDGRRKEQS